jgi:hypothetical protein
MQMFLNSFPASVNCGADGFKNLSLRVKIVSPSVVPQNVTVYLFSLSPANYFSYDLTPMFSNATVVEQQFWNNLTIPVGAGNGVSSNSAASWDNITGLRMDFTWAASSNIDVRVDGLFFRGIFKNSLEVYGSSVLLSTALSAATPFLFEWLLLTAIIWLLIKGLKGNAIWKLVMVAVGFALATLIVQSVVLLVVYSTSLPTVSYPLEILANIPGEAATAYTAVQNSISTVLLVGSVLQIVIYVWIVALGIFIVREVTSVPPQTPLGTPASTPEGEPAIAPQPFGWPKALLISAASLVLTVVILGFLGIA